MTSAIILFDLLDIEQPTAGMTGPAPALRPRSMMRSYQHFVSDKIVELEGSLMAVPMGCGKTVSTLDGVARLLEVNPTWKVLIVAPLQVSRFTWPDELGEWEHLKHLRYAVCCGTAEQRIAALDADAPITTINREVLPWLWEHIGGAVGWRWHILVYDESSRLKGFTSKTPAFKYKEGKKIKVKPNLTEFGVLVQARKLIKKVVLLSGTPAPNGLIDLGGQAKIIDQGARLGANKTAFLNRWFHVDRYSHTVEPKAHAEKEIMGLMKDVMIGLRAEDYIDLPPIFFNPIYVTLPPKVMKDYKQFKRDMVSMEYDVEAVSKGVLINKLLQFSSGGLYRSDPDVYPAVRETIPIHDEKYKALDSIIEEAAGNSVLVAYSFQFDKERLRKRYKNIVFFDEEQDFVRKWNRGEIPLAAAHPACLHPSTEVLTEYRGWVKIVDVTSDDRVFDGVEFVTHKGCHYSGRKQVKDVFGIKMTLDHRLLIGGEWVRARDVETIESAREKARYTYTGDDSGMRHVLALRPRLRDSRTELPQAQSQTKHTLQRMHFGHISQNDAQQDMVEMVQHENSCERLGGQELRRSWYRNFRLVAGLQKLLRRYGSKLSRWADDRARGCEPRILQRELCVGDTVCTTVEQAEQPRADLHGQANASGGIVQYDRGEQGKTHKPIGQGDVTGGSCGGCQEVDIRTWDYRDRHPSKEDGEIGAEVAGESTDVYDLVDCGPRHRFVIRNSDGEVFISHNSVGHGLNLQHGGYIQVWLSLTWSLELWDQFNRRLARPGQKNPTVFIHVIMARGTEDQRQYENLQTKGITQDRITENVRVRLGVK